MILRGSLERIVFTGQALEGNALGDPSERELFVYLPPSYRSGARHYPLVMVLTGFAATNASLLHFKPWEPNLLERYERLLAEGCPEAILVMPDCFTRWGGSQYLDSTSTGAYQRYLAEDVLSLVDARYRTLRSRESRAIVGKSSGGFGALRMGMDRPEVFGVVGSHAGDCAFELSVRPRFAEAAVVYERSGGVSGFLERLGGHTGPRSQAEFHALEIVALAAAYAPIGSGPLPRAALPFDFSTAMILPDIWMRWLSHDPVTRAEHDPRVLGDARLVFLDAGKADEYGLQFGARMLAQRLVNSGVRVHHEEFEGGHMGTGYRYEVSLPLLIQALDGALPCGRSGLL